MATIRGKDVVKRLFDFFAIRLQVYSDFLVVLLEASELNSPFNFDASLFYVVAEDFLKASLA